MDKQETLEISLNGYTDLPAGTIANIATALEMFAHPKELAQTRPTQSVGLSLDPIDPNDTRRYKSLFKSVGEDWLWFSRAIQTELELRAILNTKGREIYALRKDDTDIGLLELDFADPDNVELCYFGVIDEATGTDAGRWMMNQALEKVWSKPEVKRFWVHTCTIDHPKALPFYMRSGFTPFKRQIEIIADPRLSGHLRKDACQHHPILG